MPSRSITALILGALVLGAPGTSARADPLAVPPTLAAPTPIVALPRTAEAAPPPTAALEFVRLAPIRFAHNEDDLDEESLAELAAVARSLGTDPAALRLIVRGHADRTGDGSYNELLAWRRAAAVRDALIRAGAPAAMIHADARGDRDAADEDSTSSGRARNRRVELHLLRHPPGPSGY